MVKLKKKNYQRIQVASKQALFGSESGKARFPDSRQKFPDLVMFNIVQICRHL